MSGLAVARRVRVGIIDSGVAADEAGAMPVAAARRFAAAGADRAEHLAGDALGHGTAIARIVLAGHPGSDLLIAQVFSDRRKCSTAQVAAALDWLAGAGAAVVNMSFGIREPDALLRLACERAAAAGAILVAAAPARGGPVFPAAYPLCIAVCGDARCTEEQISWLGTAAADFGARPLAGSGAAHQGGASYAAARISGRVAGLLGGGAAAASIRGRLRAQCSFHGVERRASIAASEAAPGQQP